MTRIIVLILIFLQSPSLSFPQKFEDLEKRARRLERTVDSLKKELAVRTYYILSDHAAIQTNTMCSRLALELNRNFTYFGYLQEAQPDSMDGKGYQRIFYFNGYHTRSSHNQSLEADQAGYLKTVRQNLKGIKDIVVGLLVQPVKYESGWTYFPNRLIINYYDNSEADEPLISADTHTNSIKVRINGVLQEVGWN